MSPDAGIRCFPARYKRETIKESMGYLGLLDTETIYEMVCLHAVSTRSMARLSPVVYFTGHG